MRSAIQNAVLVGIGGSLGSILRHGVNSLVSLEVGLWIFPLSTLCVNLLGCLLIGVLAGLAESRTWVSVELRAFAAVGFLGGFTTFSSFGYETFGLLRDGEGLRAAANVGLHLVLGIAFVWAGYAAAGVR